MRFNNEFGGQVLIVDDEPRNLSILQELLEDDYELRSAKTGEAALEALEGFDPDIVLLDIMMPGIDGYEVCRRIKGDPRYAFTKIILVSARALVEERLKGYEAGADDYVTKPFNLDELLAKVEVFMRLKTVEEVDSIQNSFLSLMSHEARTPLNGILGFSDLILSSPEMSAEDIQEYVLDIYKCGSSFLQLVEMILLLCDLKSRRQLRLQELCVKEVILSGLRGVEAFAENSRVKVKTDIEEITANIEAEVMQRGVNAVLASLVESAAEGDKIHIKGYSQSRHFVLALSAPVFFEPDYLERAFVGFSSNDIAHHSKLGDLGFSVAKLVAQKHFGSFEVKSEKATGTELKFFLPLV